MTESLGSKISGHSLIPGASFRRRPKSSVIYASTSRRHLGSSLRRSGESIATGPIDAFDTGSGAGLPGDYRWAIISCVR